MPYIVLSITFVLFWVMSATDKGKKGPKPAAGEKAANTGGGGPKKTKGTKNADEGGAGKKNVDVLDEAAMVSNMNN